MAVWRFFSNFVRMISETMKLKANTSLMIIIAAGILLQGIVAVQYYYTRSLLADELEKRAESEITMKAIIVKNILNMAERTASDQDIDKKWLGDTLNYRHIYPSSYNFILSETGELIAGPRHNEKKQREMQHIIDMINDSTVVKTKSNSGHTTIMPVKDSDGDEGIVFFAFFKGKPRWQIAVVCYDKEVYSKLKQMRLGTGLLLLAGLLVLGLIITRFVKNDRKLQKANMEQERIGSELRIATNIQKELLPRSFSLGRDDIDVYGSLTPAREVGGDLYDFFVRDEKLFFCIGDVSGKGVPSAIVMAVIHALFRMASAHENNPARIMQTINETACEHNDTNMFVTLFIGAIDLPTGHLRYCNAGHDKPIVVGSGALEAKANLPVGLFADYKYVMEETMLGDHATLFLYTDGLTEAKNVKREMFGLDRVIAALEPVRSHDLVEQMKQEVEAFCSDAKQSDDLTMLAIRYEKVTREKVLEESILLQNDVRQIKALNAFTMQVMERLGIDAKIAKQIKLAVEEAVVNVIDYAYPSEMTGNIDVQATSDGQCLKFVITDNGVAFDPTKEVKADTTLSAEDRPIGGLGILLVRELMNSINYERTNGRNVLTLTKKIVKS